MGVNRKAAYLTWFEHLLQRRGYFTRRRQSFKFSTDYTLPIHHKNPRFRVQTPLLHRRHHPLRGKVLPDFLVLEDDPVTGGWHEPPYHINHWSTDAAGAEFRCGKHNDLWLALRDRIGNADLMQARVWWIAGIDVVQVGDITGDEVVAAWGWRTGCRGARRFLDIHGKSRHLRGTVALHGQHLQTPGARPRKGDLRHVDAPHIGLFIVHMPCPVRMDVHMVPLLDDLQLRIGCRHFCLQLSLLALEGIDAHDGMGILKELVLLQESEGEAILPDHQLGSCDQHLELLTRRRGEFRYCRGPPHLWCEDNAPKEHQHDPKATHEPLHRHCSCPRCARQSLCGSALRAGQFLQTTLSPRKHFHETEHFKLLRRGVKEMVFARTKHQIGTRFCELRHFNTVAPNEI